MLTNEKLRSLDGIPFEKWAEHGVQLVAVSSNARRVYSGITKCGCYFTRANLKTDDPNDYGQLTIMERNA